MSEPKKTAEELTGTAGTEKEAVTPNVEPTQSSEEKKSKKKGASKAIRGKKRGKKIRKIILWLLLLAVIAVIVCYKFGLFGGGAGSQSAQTYTTYTVARRDIQNVLTGTGTLAPADSYTVTALSSGEILEDYFEEGDEVLEDQLLMKIDSSSLQTSLERAQNTYDNAKKNLEDLYEQLDDLNVRSDYAGVIQVMNFEEGDEVQKGAVIASVIDRETMLIDVPFMQADTFNMAVGSPAVLTAGDTLEELYGTVDKISPSYKVNANGVKTVDVTIAVPNPGAITESTTATAKIGDYSCTQSAAFYYKVNKQVTADISGTVKTIVKDEGDYVSKGDTVIVLESDTLEDSIDNAERTLKDASNSLQDAVDAFDNYEITAPISGTVIEKNYKKGEKIGSSGNGGSSTIAVIYDLSALKFEMNIDELDIDSLALGQEVNVTSDAKPGFTYVGKITNISVQGTTSNGTTYYPITVTLDDYGNDEQGSKLRPGMNIDAEIILEKVENVIAVPIDAVGRGNKVKVIAAGNTQQPDAAASDAQQTEDALSETTRPERPDGETDGEMSGGMSGDAADRPARPDGKAPADEAALGDGSDNVGEMPSAADSAPSDGWTKGNGGTRGENGGNNTNGAGSYSTVPTGTEYTEVTVETGISDDDYIEIISGLNEGDVVIVESAAPVSGNGWGNMMGGMSGMGGMPTGGMPTGGAPSGGNRGGTGGAPGGMR